MERSAGRLYGIQLERYSVSSVIRWGRRIYPSATRYWMSSTGRFSISWVKPRISWRRGEGVARFGPLLSRLSKLLENHFPEEERLLARSARP